MKLLTAFLIFLSAQAAVAQCDSICEVVDTYAAYPGGNQEMMKYVRENVFGSFSDSCFPGEAIESKFVFELTIDNQGTPLAAKLIKGTIKAECRQQLEAKLCQMKDWIPAKKNGVAVCSIYTLPVIIEFDR